jgi:hypothetical protein
MQLRIDGPRLIRFNVDKFPISSRSFVGIQVFVGINTLIRGRFVC